MKLSRLLKQTGLALIIASMSVFGSLPAQAGMVGTGQMLEGQATTSLAAEVLAQRRWIQQQLEANGVSASDAAIRVASLSDNQVMQVKQKIDEMPAGAGVGEVILIGFLVLVITDLTGLTDVFPFIRPAK